MSTFVRHASILVALGLVVACGSPDDDEAVGPPPTDPLVYDASEETARDVGIARWGFAIDPNDPSATIFRGYDRRNALVVEIRQSLEQPELLTKRIALSMTGSLGTASRRVEHVATWTDARQVDMTYVEHVIEDTFAPGSIAARVVARLEPDADALTNPTLIRSTTASPAARTAPGSGEIRTHNQGSVLTPGGPLLMCCSQLTRESAMLSARQGSSCPLVTPSNRSLTQPRSVDVDVDVDTGGIGGIAPRALGVGADGQPVVVSPWRGPYNIVDNHCHNAAASNSSATDGYIACVSASSTTQTSGHTINWGPDPSHPGTAGAYCAYEPQANGGSTRTNSVCCWQGGAGADGAPTFTTEAAQRCVMQLCLGQASFPSWQNLWLATAPKAFPPGSTPPVANDCASSTESRSACNACCASQANRSQWLFANSLRRLLNPDDTARYLRQIEAYRSHCAVACLDRDLLRSPQQNRCMSSALDALRSRTETRSTCTSGPSGN